MVSPAKQVSPASSAGAGCSHTRIRVNAPIISGRHHGRFAEATSRAFAQLRRWRCDRGAIGAGTTLFCEVRQSDHVVAALTRRFTEMRSASVDDLIPDRRRHIGVAPFAAEARVDQHDNVRPFVDRAVPMPRKLSQIALQPVLEGAIRKKLGGVEDKATTGCASMMFPFRGYRPSSGQIFLILQAAVIDDPDIADVVRC